jgi:hypothetical protein
MAYRAVRRFGMFGTETGYLSTAPKDTSEEYNAHVDKYVTQLLEVS